MSAIRNGRSSTPLKRPVGPRSQSADTAVKTQYGELVASTRGTSDTSPHHQVHSSLRGLYGTQFASVPLSSNVNFQNVEAVGSHLGPQEETSIVLTPLQSDPSSSQVREEGVISESSPQPSIEGTPRPRVSSFPTTPTGRSAEIDNWKPSLQDEPRGLNFLSTNQHPSNIFPTFAVDQVVEDFSSDSDGSLFDVGDTPSILYPLIPNRRTSSVRRNRDPKPVHNRIETDSEAEHSSGSGSTSSGRSLRVPPVLRTAFRSMSSIPKAMVNMRSRKGGSQIPPDGKKSMPTNTPPNSDWDDDGLEESYTSQIAANVNPFEEKHHQTGIKNEVSLGTYKYKVSKVATPLNDTDLPQDASRSLSAPRASATAGGDKHNGIAHGYPGSEEDQKGHAATHTDDMTDLATLPIQNDESDGPVTTSSHGDPISAVTNPDWRRANNLAPLTRDYLDALQKRNTSLTEFRHN
ncbi:hypothetical protein M231_07353 [Tremella mesenterica]|uniref:Uncharacterized protein n=1 Tax=Tremella mesenterica TaxID=5217 RepID=A0A4Q1B9J5_TREME|nr:hypothetical protein M231_07353 [Tremella mesenterica]